MNFVGIGSTHKSSSQEKCDVVENSAYGVTVQGLAGDRLEPDYNMENNPLYEMRSLSNDRHSHKTQTTAPAVPVYETIDSVAYLPLLNVNYYVLFANSDIMKHTLWEKAIRKCSSHGTCNNLLTFLLS